MILIVLLVWFKFLIFLLCSLFLLKSPFCSSCYLIILRLEDLKRKKRKKEMKEIWLMRWQLETCWDDASCYQFIHFSGYIRIWWNGLEIKTRKLRERCEKLIEKWDERIEIWEISLCYIIYMSQLAFINHPFYDFINLICFHRVLL